VYRQVLINAKLQTGKRGKKFYRADWEKCIMEAKKMDRPCRQTEPRTVANDDYATFCKLNIPVLCVWGRAGRGGGGGGGGGGAVSEKYQYLSYGGGLLSESL